jgi:CheY-like chemotaxis protein
MPIMLGTRRIDHLSPLATGRHLNGPPVNSRLLLRSSTCGRATLSSGALGHDLARRLAEPHADGPPFPRLLQAPVFITHALIAMVERTLGVFVDFAWWETGDGVGPMTAVARLLHVDDEPAMGDLVRRVAEGCGYLVEFVSDARRFRDLVSTFVPDVIVLDLLLPDTDGFELIRHLAEIHCPAAIILLSGYDEQLIHAAHHLAAGRGLEVAAALTKPVRVADLRGILSDLSQPGSGATRRKGG